MLTFRGFLLFLPTALLMALTAFAPWLWLATAVYLLVAVILVWLDRWRARDVNRFEVSRQHDSKLSLGAENPVTLTVGQRDSRPTRLWVRDEPPDPFGVRTPLFETTLHGREPWQTTYHVHPLRRGDYQFGAVHLRWQGPLKLWTRQAQVAELGGTDTAVKVYPNLLSVRRYDLLLRQNRLQELGLRTARLFGQGSEFERLREYTPDDEFRRINWKATARRHRPVTVEYQTERSQNIMTVLDVGRMMQSPVADMAKLDYVINAVLLLGYVATGMGDKVGLLTFADEVQTMLSPALGRGQFYKMLELLYRVEAQPVEPNYRRGLSYLARKQRKRALILIFTDLSGGQGMDELIQHVSLLAKRSLPLVVTISDPDITAVAGHKPTNTTEVYQQAAAQQVLDERQVALDTLRKHGVLTLDVPANELTIAVINRYLALKGTRQL